jgi:hypothetical protein
VRLKQQPAVSSTLLQQQQQQQQDHLQLLQEPRLLLPLLLRVLVVCWREVQQGS